MKLHFILRRCFFVMLYTMIIMYVSIHMRTYITTLHLTILQCNVPSHLYGYIASQHTVIYNSKTCYSYIHVNYVYGVQTTPNELRTAFSVMRWDLFVIFYNWNLKNWIFSSSKNERQKKLFTSQIACRYAATTGC